MHAFVTGGTGFLGANLIEQLVSDGWQVTALHRPRPKAEKLARLRALGAAPVAASLDNLDSLRAALPDGLNAVFHVAGNTSMWHGGDGQQWQDNVVGTANLARAVREHFAAQPARSKARPETSPIRQPGRMIVTSSISAYGYQKNIISESSPKLAADPHFHYHYSKMHGELAVQEEIARGLDAVFLNPCAIVGKYDVSSWAQTFFMLAENKLPGVPPGAGSFCHAGAVARAHINAYHRGRRGENYILAGIDASFLEFFRMIADLVGVPAPRRTTPAFAIHTIAALSGFLSRFTGREPAVTPQKASMLTSRALADSTRAERELGYRNQIGLEDMLREARDWLVTEDLLRLPQHQ